MKLSCLYSSDYVKRLSSVSIACVIFIDKSTDRLVYTGQKVLLALLSNSITIRSW